MIKNGSRLLLAKPKTLDLQGTISLCLQERLLASDIYAESQEKLDELMSAQSAFINKTEREMKETEIERDKKIEKLRKPIIEKVKTLTDSIVITNDILAKLLSQNTGMQYKVFVCELNDYDIANPPYSIYIGAISENDKGFNKIDDKKFNVIDEDDEIKFKTLYQEIFKYKLDEDDYEMCLKMNWTLPYIFEKMERDGFIQGTTFDAYTARNGHIACPKDYEESAFLQDEFDLHMITEAFKNGILSEKYLNFYMDDFLFKPLDEYVTKLLQSSTEDNGENE